MANKSITVRLLGDSKGLTDALDNASSGIGRFARGAGAAFAVGVGAIAVGSAALGVSAVRAASDLNETLSKTGAIFDESAAGIIAWSETTAQALGISQTAALDYASGFGGALKEIGGLSEEQAASTAQELTKLTADLGSFFNDSNENVAAAIGSALTGEFEPLKKYNVIVNDAMLRQKAFELGIYDGTGALDAQTKQLATLALITEQTSDAQGDFERTSDGLANQTKQLQARFEDLKTGLGEKLLPVVNQVFAFLLDNAPQIEAVAGRAFEVVGDVVAALVPTFQSLVGAAQTVFAAFQGDGSGAEDGPLATVGVILRDVVDFLVTNVPPAIDALVAGFQVVADWVAEHWPEISATIEAAVDTIETVITAVVDIVTALWDQFGDDIINVVTILAETIVPLIQGAFDIIQGIFEVFAGLFTGDWGRLWDGVQQILSGAWTIITAAVEGAFDLIVELVGAAMGALLDVVTTIGGDVIDWFAGLGADILGAVGDLGRTLYNAGKDIIDGLWDGLKDKWESVKDWFGDITSAIPDFKGPMEVDRKLLKASGAAIMAGFNEGLDVGWAQTQARLTGFTSDIGVSFQPEAIAASSGFVGGSGVVNNFNISTVRRPLAEEFNELLVLQGALSR